MGNALTNSGGGITTVVTTQLPKLRDITYELIAICSSQDIDVSNRVHVLLAPFMPDYGKLHRALAEVETIALSIGLRVVPRGSFASNTALSFREKPSDLDLDLVVPVNHPVRRNSGDLEAHVALRTIVQRLCDSAFQSLCTEETMTRSLKCRSTDGVDVDLFPKKVQEGNEEMLVGLHKYQTMWTGAGPQWVNFTPVTGLRRDIICLIKLLKAHRCPDLKSYHILIATEASSVPMVTAYNGETLKQNLTSVFGCLRAAYANEHPHGMQAVDIDFQLHNLAVPPNAAERRAEDHQKANRVAQALVTLRSDFV